MEGYSFCGLSEQLATAEIRRSNLARWWVVADGWPARIPRDVVRRCSQSAMDMWATVGNVRGVEASSEGAADFVIRPAAIDGRQGVLADCMLPGPPVQTCRCDRDELWTVLLGVQPNSELIDLDRVLRHEFGHFWGIGHDQRGTKSLMAPTFSWQVWEPQAWDVQQIQSMYGRPVVTPADDEEGVYYLVGFDRRGKEVRRYRPFE